MDVIKDETPKDPLEVEHPGHELYHSIISVLIIAIVIGSQVGLVLWKKHHYKSFQMLTLAGLWAIPFILSLIAGYIRMIIVWTIFTAISAYLTLVKAQETPLAKETPKNIYLWFFLVYRFSYGAAIFGYILVMLSIFQILPEQAIDYGFLVIFYGLYYGVLGRDIAELCTDRVASKMGFTGKGIPSRQLPPMTCTICGDVYRDDEVVRLNCQHEFHQWCLRGWTIIGKKNTCPFCSEKVEIKNQNPWEKTGVLWAQLLDSLRYLIVWNPVIIMVIQLVIRILDHHEEVTTVN